MSDATQITQLTAPGRGAVAVTRFSIRSPESAVDLDARFHAANGMRPSQAAVGRILYGLWDGEDVVVVRVGDQDWEIHCHGGDAAVQRISRQLMPTGDAGAPAPRDRSATDSAPRLQQALLEQLLKCRTRRTASLLLTQCNGVLSHFLTTLSEQPDANAAAAVLRDFLQWRTFARHLTHPWRVAVIGQPNAGKSSLLNAIVGYERSIVFEQPGTTRDLVATEITLDDWPFVLVDTAGIREQTSNDIEAAGVASARRSVASCDACLLVVDAQQGWTRIEDELLKTVPTGCPTAILWNKTDLPQHKPAPPEDIMPRTQTINTSAIQADGIDDILNWLPAALVPTLPEADQALPVVEPLTEQLTEFVAQPTQGSLKNILDKWL